MWFLFPVLGDPGGRSQGAINSVLLGAVSWDLLKDGLFGCTQKGPDFAKLKELRPFVMW